MGDLTNRAFTEQALLDAWDQTRAAALADGEASQAVEQFEAAAARHVSRLAAELADEHSSRTRSSRSTSRSRSAGSAASPCPSWETGSWNELC